MHGGRRRDRRGLRRLRNHNPRDEVADDGWRRSEEEQRPDEPDDGRVYVHMIRQAGANPSDLAVGVRTHQALGRRRRLCRGDRLARAADVTEIRRCSNFTLTAWASHSSTSRGIPEKARTSLPYFPTARYAAHGQKVSFRWPSEDLPASV